MDLRYLGTEGTGGDTAFWLWENAGVNPSSIQGLLPLAELDYQNWQPTGRR